MHPENFPRLSEDNFRITSPAKWEYNCLAWTLNDTMTWWSTAPGYYWPPRVPRPMTNLVNVIQLYEREGFTRCDSAAFEAGFERIVLYSADGHFVHAARQLENGRWTSKLGPHEDIEHDTPEALLGGEFELVACILRRSRSV